MTQVTSAELHLSPRPGSVHKLLVLDSLVEVARMEFEYHKPENAMHALADLMEERGLTEAVVHDHGHAVTFSNDRVVLDVEHLRRFANSDMFKERAKRMLLPGLPEASEHITHVVETSQGVFSRHGSYADANWNAAILGDAAVVTVMRRGSAA